jgi:hypothetical protein
MSVVVVLKVGGGKWGGEMVYVTTRLRSNTIKVNHLNKTFISD